MSQKTPEQTARSLQRRTHSLPQRFLLAAPANAKRSRRRLEDPKEVLGDLDLDMIALWTRSINHVKAAAILPHLEATFA